MDGLPEELSVKIVSYLDFISWWRLRLCNKYYHSFTQSYFASQSTTVQKLITYSSVEVTLANLWLDSEYSAVDHLLFHIEKRGYPFSNDDFIEHLIIRGTTQSVSQFIIDYRPELSCHTPFLIAAELGKLETLQFLVETCSCDFDIMRLTISAISSRSLPVFEYCYQRYRLTINSHKECKFVIWAIYRDNLPVVKYLLTKGKLRLRDKLNRRTELARANGKRSCLDLVKFNSIEMVKYVHESGLNINFTYIFTRAAKKLNYPMLDYLIAHHSEVIDFKFCLFELITQGRKYNLHILLEIYPQHLADYDNELLRVATNKGQVVIIEYLLTRMSTVNWEELIERAKIDYVGRWLQRYRTKLQRQIALH